MGAVAVVAGAGAACSHRTATSMRFLTEDEATTLGAWCECLIPADQDPGARDAGVVNYIDRQLTLKFKKLKPAYRSALRAIDEYARREKGRTFAQLDLAAQTALLEAMDEGNAPMELWSDGGRADFNMVLDHTMQGFYGSPRHGGNKDHVSWRMLGVPPVPIRGRLHYNVAESFPARSKS